MRLKPGLIMAALAMVLAPYPAPAQHATDLRAGVRAPVEANSSARPLIRFEPKDNGSYWKEGALVLGVPVAIGTYLFANGMSGEEGNSVLNGLFAGVVAGAIGALIGWFIPK